MEAQALLPLHLTPLQNDFLQRFLVEEVNKLLEPHWRQVIAWRTGTPKEKADISEDAPEGFVLWDGKEERIWTDVFKFTWDAPKTDKERKLKYLCMIPSHRIFWEIVLAFYVLFFPQTYPDGAAVAKALRSFFSRMKYSPEGTLNFKPQHWKFLRQLEKGERKLLFLENPIECWVALFTVIWANANEKALDDEDLWNGQIQDLIEMKCDEIESDPEHPIRKWELEWEGINMSPPMTTEKFNTLGSLPK